MDNLINQVRKHLWDLLAKKSITKISASDFPVSTFDPRVIQRLFPEQNFFMAFILADIEERASHLSTDRSLDASDRLFDILMQMFDDLMDQQIAIKNSINNLKYSPQTLPKLLPYTNKLCTEIMNAAHIHRIEIKPDFLTSHFPNISLPKLTAPNIIKNLSFQLFLFWIFNEWANDSSNDNEVTMAALQQALDDAKTYIVFDDIPSCEDYVY